MAAHFNVTIPLGSKLAPAENLANAIEGFSENARGVVAGSETDYGLRAASGSSSAIRASSKSGVGIEGETESGEAGIHGTSPNAIGVRGVSGKATGVFGAGQTGGHFEGTVNDAEGKAEGVHAVTASKGAAVAAYNTNAAGDGFAIFAKKDGGQGFAGFFDGNVWVGGVLSVGKDIVLTGADCAEDFDVVSEEGIEPGDVLTLGDDGRLQPCHSEYDRRVVGVVSGAGHFRPALVLDRQSATRSRKPIALVGKVYCKVDADFGAIEIGHLLTTSSTPGHAMKAADPCKAFGSVIGKALAPLTMGRGLIVILVSLQ